ncbi:NADPH-dependent F420 reductase [Jiulongibacter sediminis]|uniref:NADP oxidoreductase coenzyme F420-dependent n=1 Tax=Jiulongibacter sediminis TaxID=1605367 RepID=A0A0P7C4Y5_9BACT|nr:NAD(P)-binding domain-containing protein [Jiulongibacter sediminis]KPM49768.1 NADP oxidoreductase coenzyme F420-dependent [Jiulongibacter sediminis]TBX26805.1 NADP oxidoreductase coenzyme F420-dependent [Jiulongibacter sediminis]
MKNKSDLKVSIVGLGTIGKVLAQNLVKNGREVMVSDRDLNKSKGFAKELGNLAKPLSIEEAIQNSDIIIPAIWFSAFGDFFEQNADSLKGKIIVDPSNPIAPNDKGGFDKIIPENESAGVINANALPSGARLVKALGTLGAASLEHKANSTPDKQVLFYALDDEKIKREIEMLIEDTGFSPVGVGDISQSIRIEVFGDLHEFGPLGKTVDTEEALSLV